MRRIRIATLLSISAMPLAAAQQASIVELESPINGWNVYGFVDHAEEFSANYPTPPVDRGRQRLRKRIQGRLVGAPADKGVAQLIVNGNAMPLYTNPDGGFLRHYAFGRGSNSVEVRTPDGNSKKRVQFYEANPTLVQSRLRIICAWDDQRAEVDMHVITPDGQHASWSDPVLQQGGGLDVDSVDGAGPENFSTATPLHGIYQVYVNYWGNFTSAGYNFTAGANEQPVITTQVTLIYNENTPQERRETMIVPLRRVGDMTLVKAFQY